MMDTMMLVTENRSGNTFRCSRLWSMLDEQMGEGLKCEELICISTQGSPAGSLHYHQLEARTKQLVEKLVWKYSWN